jgi:hypothetical protein
MCAPLDVSNFRLGWSTLWAVALGTLPGNARLPTAAAAAIFQRRRFAVR